MSIAANPFERRSASAEVAMRGRRLEGYAALFGAEARIGSFRESIRAGAFTETLRAKTDILALVDHDPGRVLGRTRSGTLRLAEDARGLHFSVDLPDTSAARDVLALAERGDLGGASFQFTVPPGGDVWRGEKRELIAVKLHEVSVISAWPAYDGTDVAARSLAAGGMKINLAKLWLEVLK